MHNVYRENPGADDDEEIGEIASSSSDSDSAEEGDKEELLDKRAGRQHSLWLLNMVCIKYIESVPASAVLNLMCASCPTTCIPLQISCT